MDGRGRFLSGNHVPTEALTTDGLNIISPGGRGGGGGILSQLADNPFFTAVGILTLDATVFPFG